MTEEAIISDVLIPQLKALTSGACDASTALIGPTAVIDSILLVSFLLSVEEVWNSRSEKKIRIISDRALSEKSSPFQSISTLAAYLQKLAASA